jgi:hypothetical protein
VLKYSSMSRNYHLHNSSNRHSLENRDDYSSRLLKGRTLLLRDGLSLRLEIAHRANRNFDVSENTSPTFEFVRLRSARRFSAC